MQQSTQEIAKSILEAMEPYSKIRIPLHLLQSNTSNTMNLTPEMLNQRLNEFVASQSTEVTPLSEFLIGQVGAAQYEKLKQMAEHNQGVLQSGTQSKPVSDLLSPARVMQQALIEHTTDPLAVYVAVKTACGVAVAVKEVMLKIPFAMTQGQIAHAFSFSIPRVFFPVNFQYDYTPYGDGHIYLAFGHDRKDPDEFIMMEVDTVGGKTTFRYAAAGGFDIETPLRQIAEEFTAKK